MGAYRSRAEAYRSLGRAVEAQEDLDHVSFRQPTARRSGTLEDDLDDDVVGIGRYVLSFVLAGFVGLAVQYGLRRKGWMATWINSIIVIVGVALMAAAG